jgi:thymidine kinase
MAKLYFRYGAMNSGKTTAILQVAFNYEERDMRVLTIKPGIDTKGGDAIVARIGAERIVDIQADRETNLFEIVKSSAQQEPKLACVLVDESQFLTEAQVNQLFEVAITLNIPVICYGLRVDFQTKAFEGAKRLFELAHSIEELKTICRCGKKAILNGRKINGEFVSSGSQVAIDGEEAISYESLCGNCYLKFVGPVGS